MGQAMNEYLARHGNVSPKPKSANGSAQMVLSCRCGTTIAVDVFSVHHCDRNCTHVDPDTLDIPEGWHVSLPQRMHDGSIEGGYIRCPKHRQIV